MWNVLLRMIDRSEGEGEGEGEDKPGGYAGSVAPDVFAYSACLNACAHTKGDTSSRRRALIIAIELFEEIKANPRYGTPNAFIYGTLLKVCARHSSDSAERVRLMEVVFLECCREGYLSVQGLEQIRRFAPYELRTRLLGDGKDPIPRDWYRNVRRRDHPLPVVHRL